MLLKLLGTAGLLAGLTMLASSTLVFCMLMLAFSTDSAQSSDKLPGLLVYGAGAIAIVFLVAAVLIPPVLFWNDASWKSILRPAIIGFAGAVLTMLVAWIGIVAR